MIHIRIDDFEENSRRQFACGIGPELPEGDTYYFASELSSRKADCPLCNPGGPQELGTPISELGSRPGESGYTRFVGISESWGFQ